MTYFEDLTPYTYLVGHASDPEEPWPGLPLVNIGWLEPGRPFRTGAAPDHLVPALETLAKRYRVHQTRGFHRCGLCPTGQGGAAAEGRHDDQEMIRRGSAEFRVRGLNVVYAAPELAVHYVRTHGYLPPDEFCSAAVNQAKDLWSPVGRRYRCLLRTLRQRAKQLGNEWRIFVATSRRQTMAAKGRPRVVIDLPRRAGTWQGLDMSFVDRLLPTSNA